MKKIFTFVSEILIIISSISFVLFVINKVLQGNTFERYRTNWLFEIDYFSIVLFFIVALLSWPIYFIIRRINKNRLEKEVKKSLDKQRNSKKI